MMTGQILEKSQIPVPVKGALPCFAKASILLAQSALTPCGKYDSDP